MENVASKIIGKPDEKRDWKIEPTAHARLYEQSAPELAAILRTEAVQATAEQYERLNEAAGKEQKSFKRYSNLANVMVLLTGLAGAAVLWVNAQELAKVRKEELLRWCGAAAGLFGCVATFAITVVKGRAASAQWMTFRAGAEAARLEYFTRATAAPENASVGLALIQLEYYVRYLYESQKTYFKNAIGKHRKGSMRTLIIRGTGAGLATLGAAVAGFAGSGWVWLAAVGVGGAALAAFAETREGIYQDTRNERNYNRTLEILVDLGKTLKEIREAAAADDRAKMDEFVKAVNEALAEDHKTWGEAKTASAAALDSLEKKLKK